MTRLTVLQLNDLHGYIAPHPEMRRDDGGEWVFATMGGLARIKTIFEQARSNNPGGVIALDNGDTFHGTHFAVADQARAMIPLINRLGFAAMTLHWEFAYGPDRVEAIAGALDHPVLAANIYRQDSGELFLPPVHILERQGKRIGIIGLACPIVDKTMPPAFSKGLRFTIGVEEAARHLEQLRERVDLVMVLSHLGFPQDIQLARDVPGIDVIVSGHTHNRMDNAITVDGTIIFQSGCHGSFVGKLDLELGDRGIKNWHHQLIAVDENIPEDPAMRRAVDQALERESKAMGELVGHTEVALHRYAMLSCPMDDLLLEAIAEAAGTAIAFSNGWRYGAPVPPGPVKLNDLWNMVPVDPPVSTAQVSGAEIREMLEENLERTFAANPYDQMGGYIKRMRSIRMIFKEENGKGHRIEHLFVEGCPVEDERQYDVSFITEQGVPARFGRNRKTLEISAIEALRRRLQRPFTRADIGSSVVIA